MAETGAGAPSAGRRRKKGAGKITVSLYINGVPYEFGCKCTFCTKEKAIFHCPECGDFYCEGCDYTAHNTEKRKGHIRKKLSHLSLKVAAKYVTFAVRYHVGVLILQKRARMYIRRFFDPKSCCHFYYNSKYGTVSWKKPYCLRKHELFPFISEAEAATRIQVVYTLSLAHIHSLTHLIPM